MTYNSRSIRKHKGKLVNIHFINKYGEPDWLVGEIIAHSQTMIIFNVNKTGRDERIERAIEYENIINISPPELAQEK